MTSERSVTYRLRRHPSEIPRAREQARKALTDWGLADHTDLAELIVSELATNALRHGAGPITVHLSYASDRDLWLEVHDHSLDYPILRLASADDEQGRGLPLLNGLASVHSGVLGVTAGQSWPGKTIYFAVTLAGATGSLDPGGGRS
jgi:anti-sigma regulatory factor (Ser/Thr protein kinase)